MYRQKIFRAETKVADAKAGRIEAAVSDETPDRGGDVIRQDGWDLENFQRHPVLLASHDYMHLRAQIGEWESMEVRGKRLVGVARYYIGEGNADADWGFNLAAKGRAAYSVGFMNLESKERDGGGLEFLRQELLEVSHVTIPANANALQLMMKSHLDPTISALIEEQLAETVGDAVSRAGRVMSQANLDKLHSIMGSLAVIHSGVCDMGDDCPMEGKAWLPARSDAHEQFDKEPPDRVAAPGYGAALLESAEAVRRDYIANLSRLSS